MYSNLSFNIAFVNTPSRKIYNSTTLSGPDASSTYDELYFIRGKARHFISFQHYKELVPMMETGKVDFTAQATLYLGVWSSEPSRNMTCSPIVARNDAVVMTKVFKPKKRSLHVMDSLDFFNLDVVITLAILIATVILLTAIFKKLYKLENGMTARWYVLSGICSSVIGIRGGMANPGFTIKPCFTILLLSMIVVVYLILLWFGCLFAVDLITL